MNSMAIGSIVGKIGNKFMDILIDIEKKIDYTVMKLRKRLLKLALQIVFFVISFIFLLTGLVLFLSRFFPLDLVLLVIGAIVLYVALLFNVVK